MSGFDLVPVDGGAAVHLPPGDTVLGRGPLLAVSDRRISRRHALLQNLDGKLRLKATHLNPCFLQSSLTDDPQPLLRDSWWPLHDGDFFSLLPGQFVYKVVAVGGATDTSTRNGHVVKEEKQEEEELHDSPEPDMEPSCPIRADCRQTPPHDESPAAGLSEQKPSPHRQPATNQDAVEDSGGPSVGRTRVLPAWMMAAITKSNDSSPKPKVKSVKRSTSSQQATPTAAYSPEEAELSEEEEEQRPRKKRRKEEKVRATPTTATDAAYSPPPATLVSDISEPEDNRKSMSSVSAPSKHPLRTPCPYGRDCYRKNPVHFQEVSHPGDTDYEEEEEEDALDRPECPYGTDCYRKNPLHRKEFKHTKRTARATHPIPKKSPAHDEGDEDDDSFIDDDSDDLGDDEDYVPPDSEDSGKEDIRRLQKEAKVFFQRRK